MIPYPPLTVVRLKKLWPHARKQGHEKGEIWRVGYYSKQDGLKCIWLVDEKGEYNWTAEASWLDDKFEVLSLSREKSYFGRNRPLFGKLTATEKKKYSQAGSRPKDSKEPIQPLQPTPLKRRG